MEEKFVFQLCKKHEINSKIYILTRVGYVENAVIDEEENLIYNENGQSITVPICTNEKFLKSNNKYCHAFICSLDNLLTLYDGNGYEESYQTYIKECEKITSIVYYDEQSKVYRQLEFDLKTIDSLYMFSEVCLQFDYYKNINKEIMTLMEDKVIMTKELYARISNAVKNGEIDYLKELFKRTDAEFEDKELEKLSENETSNNNELSSKTLDEVMGLLHELTGLENVKTEIKRLTNYLEFVKKSADFANIQRPNLNMVFTGNPGTGKTTIAKILSVILNKMGFANDKIFECTAKDFIGEYVGQTAPKTKELINKAQGGIIFIDEAYGFVSSGNSYVQEALTEILKEMEKNRTIFIFSGYKDEMEDFIKFNSGLTSRIGYYFNFEDYSVEQLFDIFKNKLNETKLILSEECKDKIIDIIRQAKESQNFGNGRFIDKLLSNIIIEHANNL